MRARRACFGQGRVRTLGRRDLDVIALVRGGGARTDLAAFDTEPLVRAIATCPSRFSPASDTRSTTASPMMSTLVGEDSDGVRRTAGRARRRVRAPDRGAVGDCARRGVALDRRARRPSAGARGRHLAAGTRGTLTVASGSSPEMQQLRCPTRRRWRARRGARVQPSWRGCCVDAGAWRAIARRRSQCCRGRPPAGPSCATRSGRLAPSGRGVRRVRACARPGAGAGPRLVDHAAPCRWRCLAEPRRASRRATGSPRRWPGASLNSMVDEPGALDE